MRIHSPSREAKMISTTSGNKNNRTLNGSTSRHHRENLLNVIHFRDSQKRSSNDQMVLKKTSGSINLIQPKTKNLPIIDREALPVNPLSDELINYINFYNSLDLKNELRYLNVHFDILNVIINNIYLLKSQLNIDLPDLREKVSNEQIEVKKQLAVYQYLNNILGRYPQKIVLGEDPRHEWPCEESKYKSFWNESKYSEILRHIDFLWHFKRPHLIENKHHFCEMLRYFAEQDLTILGITQENLSNLDGLFETVPNEWHGSSSIRGHLSVIRKHTSINMKSFESQFSEIFQDAQKTLNGEQPSEVLLTKIEIYYNIFSSFFRRETKNILVYDPVYDKGIMDVFGGQNNVIDLFKLAANAIGSAFNSYKDLISKNESDLSVIGNMHQVANSLYTILYLGRKCINAESDSIHFITERDEPAKMQTEPNEGPMSMRSGSMLNEDNPPKSPLKLPSYFRVIKEERHPRNKVFFGGSKSSRFGGPEQIRSPNLGHNTAGQTDFSNLSQNILTLLRHYSNLKSLVDKIKESPAEKRKALDELNKSIEKQLKTLLEGEESKAGGLSPENEATYLIELQEIVNSELNK